jgi:hypothetical protein
MVSSTAVMLTAMAAAYAQPSDTIVANPLAVKLHRIWTMTGSPITLDQVGDGIGPVGDINGDSLEDFAVHVGRTGKWKVFYGHQGAPDTATVWSFDSSGAVPAYPVVGDFWGTGHKAVGFARGEIDDSDNHRKYYYKLHLFRTDDGHLPDTAAVIVDPHRMMAGLSQINVTDILAHDLDGDGADELIVVTSMVQRQEWSRHAEVWIYKGGPGFQVDTPTVIIRDPEENSDESKFFTSIGDFDGDHRPDILTAGFYGADGARFSFWFSSPASPGSWAGLDSIPRVIRLSTLGHPRIGYGLTTLDCDGDGMLDLLLPGPDGHVYLYRTQATGKSSRTRSFDLADADRRFYREQSLFTDNLGYLNDATHRYQMPCIAGPSPSGKSAIVLGLASGPAGPDESYEAFYAADLDGLIEGNVVGTIRPISDCNGDGWDDVLTSNFSWPGQNWGIALVLAGGPYIPSDPSSGVRRVDLEEKSKAISVWPNPVRDELNIAWRGDLRHMPRSFAVHDIAGREIAHGEVAPGMGAVIWHCDDVPSGEYLLSIHDEHGEHIATVRLLKQ